MKKKYLLILAVLCCCCQTQTNSDSVDLHLLSKEIVPNRTHKSQIRKLLGNPVAQKKYKSGAERWIYEAANGSETHTPLISSKRLQKEPQESIDIFNEKFSSLVIEFNSTGVVQSFDYLESTEKVRHAFVQKK